MALALFPACGGGGSGVVEEDDPPFTPPPDRNLTPFDPDFGIQGWASAGLATHAEVKALVMQENGAIVAGGYWSEDGPANDSAVLTRFSAAGQIDTEFADQGLALLEGFTAPLGNGRQSVVDIAIQADGGIVAAVVSDPPTNLMTLVALDPAGALQASFGDAGRVALELTSWNYPLTKPLDVGGDGKLVVAGTHVVGSTPTLAVERYNADGTIDTDFGVDGRSLVDVGGASFSGASAVTVLNDNRILVSGAAADDAFVVMLDTDGNLDTDFAGTGLRQIDLGGASVFDRVTAQELSGDTITLLMRSVFSETPLVVARLNLDGTFTEGFGDGGVVAFTDETLPATVDATSDFVALSVTPGGELFIPAMLVLRGQKFDGGYLHLASDGSLKSVGDGGVVRLSYPGTLDFRDTDAILRQPDGKLVLAGRVGDVVAGDFGVVRLLAP